MNIYRHFLDSSLRFKILFGLLLSLVPMLVIMGISYTSARSNAVETSERIMKLVNDSGAKEINGFIKAQQAVFSDWTREDVYGMAIEFETSTELQGHFQSVLEGQKGIALIMVTDREGKVFEAAVGGHLNGASGDAFKGRVVQEALQLIKKGARSAMLVQSDFMKQLGLKSATTFLYSFKTNDSEGKPNGLFLAYMDWSHLQAVVVSVANELTANGFVNSRVALLDAASKNRLGDSNTATAGNPLVVTDELTSWLKGSNGGEVHQFDIGNETTYVTGAPLQSAASLIQEDGGARDASELYLMGFVPESDIMATVRKILWTSAGIAGGGGLLILLIGLFIVRLISKPLNRIISGLNDGADQVAASSEQISVTSQQLAEGSSEQAASIEETSSSLEEMSSMTRQNAEHAGQADSLMKEASQVVQEANDSMTELNTSMDQISKASEETSKIIKTIDEIAFQTNLLALNAAVEAARAGEAGAGFAVVADEVRNLAMRAAGAAKDTAELIEGTVKKVAGGTKLVASTTEAFAKVAHSTSKVTELVGEIAAASNEQAQGVEQVNTAVTEMDKVTQQNAAGAEESSSASQEMNTQAEQMKRIVGELVAMVSANGHGGPARSSVAAAGTPQTPIRKALGFAAPAKRAQSQSLVAERSKEITPQQAIPLDDEDFKDF